MRRGINWHRERARQNTPEGVCDLALWYLASEWQWKPWVPQWLRQLLKLEPFWWLVQHEKFPAQWLGQWLVPLSTSTTPA
jgi:hypothetical protein